MLLQNSRAASPRFSLAFRFMSDTNLMFLKSQRVSNLTPRVPSVQHSFSGVVIHHDVVAVLVREQYVGIPLFSCLGVISKVDGGGSSIVVNTVDHSTRHKRIAHCVHPFCARAVKQNNIKFKVVKSNVSTLP